MIRNLFHPTYTATIVFWLGASITALAQYGAEVVSYEAGTTPAGGYTNPSAALGEPERFTGDGSMYPGIVSPFSPPYLDTEIVSVGEGGHITLKLSHFAMPQAGLEIGVFENTGLEIDFGNLTALDPVSTFGDDHAFVEVSANGTYWKSLSPTAIHFNRPSNGYTDLSDPFSATPGTDLSDFQQPFDADMNEFAGLPYSDPSGPDLLEVLAGSGGGTWLDISSTGLPRVGYIRFSVANDFTATNQNFELDAVSIAHGAVGRAVPEPGAIASALLALFSMLITIRRRSY